MKAKFPRRSVCKTNPVKTSKNAIFIVDKYFLESEGDVFADDLGHWIKSKTKKFTFGGNDGTYVKTDEYNHGSFDKVIKVTRYIHYLRNSPDFHRVAVFINESSYIFKQYYFDDGEHDIIVEQPHGNSKINTRPHRRSKESLKEKMKNSKYGPKETVHRLLEDAGGILQVHSPNDFPKNRQQIKNLKRKSDDNLKDGIVNLIDTCNKEHELKNIFVRTVLTSPEKIVFLSSENQLNDINRFCTNNARFCILGIDPTYNVSLCYLTVTTYRHLHFRTNKREHLVKIGPVLIHTRKEYSSYFHLPNLMLQAQPALKNIKVVGSDSEKNVYLPFKNLMPDTCSLLCDIHMKGNLMGKGSKLNLNKEQMTEILNDIFGRNVGETIEKGLVHHTVDFDLKLDHLREKWMGFGGKGNQFYNCFISHKVEGIRNCMSSELRSMACLGYPPKPYTQNANECINIVIKPRGSQKCKSIIDVVNRVRDIVMKQEVQVNLSLVGQGD